MRRPRVSTPRRDPISSRWCPGLLPEINASPSLWTRQCDEVQRVLHLRQAFCGRQFGLPALFPATPAGAHLRLRVGMDRTVRHRDRLHRDGVTRVARGPRHMDYNHSCRYDDCIY